MRGDLPAAACRLLECLPVRTHEQSRDDYEDRLSANNFRRVQIGAVRFESLTEAGRQLGKSRTSVRNMIARGEAHYLDAPAQKSGAPHKRRSALSRR